MKLDQLSPSHDYMSFLFKGPWGFGKTIAAASFAKLGPIHISYWDKKGPIELLQFFKKYAPHLIKNIEFDVYGAHNANEYLNMMFKLAKECRYVAEINDSVTTMTSAAVNWSLGFKDNKKARKENSINIPDFDEYKVETSLVTQALDISRVLPCHVIWTCHPLPSMKIESSGDGKVGRISKVNSIVTYGSKVAGIVPGQFSEIYHFSKRSNYDAGRGKSNIQYLVSTEQIGDDYAKSNIGLNCEMDITDRLFYEVWKEEVGKMEAGTNEVKQEEAKPNPFAGVTTNTTKDAPAKKPWE